MKVDPVESVESGLHVTTSSITVYGTTSKAYEFAAPVDVDFNSMVSFNVTLGNGVQALTLCVDDDIKANSGVDGRVESTCLALGGSAIDEILDDYLSPETIGSVGVKTAVTFQLWQMFSSRNSPIKYLGIIQVVNENDVSVTESKIEDVLFYKDIEESTRRLSTGSDLCTCGPDELASTTKPGLHHHCVYEGDFCSPAEDKLLEIQKNENDYCSSHSECRSGLCENDKCTSKVRITYSVHTELYYDFIFTHIHNRI